MANPPDRLQEGIEDLITACREILRTAAPAEIEAAFLYGSSLGPHFRSDSDIDIAVLDSENHRLTWSDQARLMDALERATGHGVDLRMLRESSPSHQVHVLEHGRRVWVRDPAEVERYTRKLLPAARKAQERSKQEWPRVLDRIAGLAIPR